MTEDVSKKLAQVAEAAVSGIREDRMDQKTEHQCWVENFMEKAGQTVPDKPTVPDEATRISRARLILEEAFETIERGLGLSVVSKTHWVNGEQIRVTFSDMELVADHEPNMEELADGCADIKVVTTGTLSACGIADKELQEAVDWANLTKFGPGGYRDEHGKWHKPPGWKHPDIMKCLRDQGYEG